jgi:hypothetical protein
MSIVMEELDRMKRNETEMLLRSEQQEERMRRWEEIKDKAHLYRTARIRYNKQWVRVVGLRRMMVFVCEHVDGRSQDYGVEELECFCI